MTAQATPIIILTGYLGAGKTTLLQRLLDETDKRLAVIMNEFGELSVDGTIIKGKDVDIVELSGGCVCCSMTGEFEAAVREIIAKAAPDLIVIETTGVAEPDALVDDITQNLTGVRLDAVVTIVDADAMARFPSLGHTGRVQIEMADVLILNKIDLVSAEQKQEIKKKIAELNERAHIFEATRGDVDVDVLFDLRRDVTTTARRHGHVAQEYIGSFTFEGTTMDRDALEQVLDTLPANVYRVKGFVVTPDGTTLLNYVFGRWALEDTGAARTGGGTQLVFIGKQIEDIRDGLLRKLKACMTQG